MWTLFPFVIFIQIQYSDRIILTNWWHNHPNHPEGTLWYVYIAFILFYFGLPFHWPQTKRYDQSLMEWKEMCFTYYNHKKNMLPTHKRWKRCTKRTNCILTLTYVYNIISHMHAWKENKRSQKKIIIKKIKLIKRETKTGHKEKILSDILLNNRSR